jgi:hypothetical protein
MTKLSKEKPRKSTVHGDYAAKEEGNGDCGTTAAGNRRKGKKMKESLLLVCILLLMNCLFSLQMAKMSSHSSFVVLTPRSWRAAYRQGTC